MGARISIQFEKENEKSVVLFSHWGGEEFAEQAEQYAEDLKEASQKRCRELRETSIWGLMKMTETTATMGTK